MIKLTKDELLSELRHGASKNLIKLRDDAADHIEQLHKDIGILLSIIDYLAECTGEGPEGEDAVLVEQIRRWPGDEKQPIEALCE